MRIDLSGKVIVVTGGSEGIGLGIAKTVAACGASVAIISRDEEEMQDAVKAINEAAIDSAAGENAGRGSRIAPNGAAIYAKADVTQDGELKSAIRKIVDNFGQIDGLVANAGINGTWTPIDEMDPEDWRKTIDVNLTGTFFSIRHVVPLMRKRNSGSIVIMSSINGTRTFTNEGASAYASSKAGQLALGKMLALELAKSKIRVNVICPGGIQSQIHEKTEKENLDKIENPAEYPEGAIPLTGGKMGEPRDVAGITSFLLSDLASHITGTPVWVDGAQSLLQ